MFAPTGFDSPFLGVDQLPISVVHYVSTRDTAETGASILYAIYEGRIPLLSLAFVRGRH